MGRMTICRTAEFSAGVPSERSTKGRGLNFELEVYIVGDTNKETGLVVNLTEVKTILSAIVSQLDHKNLAFEMPNKTKFTYENLLLWIHSQIISSLRTELTLQQIRLHCGSEGSYIYGQEFRSIPVSTPPFTKGKLC